MASEFINAFNKCVYMVSNPDAFITDDISLPPMYILKTYAATNPGLMSYFSKNYYINSDYDIHYSRLTTRDIIEALRDYASKYGLYNPMIVSGSSSRNKKSSIAMRDDIKASLRSDELSILSEALDEDDNSNYELYYDLTSAQLKKSAKVKKNEVIDLPLDLLFLHNKDFGPRAAQLFDKFMTFYNLNNSSYKVMEVSNNSSVKECIVKRNPKLIVLLGAAACDSMNINKDGIVNRCGNIEVYNGSKYIIALGLTYVLENINNEDITNNMSNVFNTICETLFYENDTDDSASKLSKKPGTLLTSGKIYSYKGLPEKYYKPEWILIDTVEKDRKTVEHVFRNIKTNKKEIHHVKSFEYDYYYILKNPHALSKPFVKATETFCKRGPYKAVKEDSEIAAMSRETVVYNTSIRFPTRASTDYYYNTEEELEYLPKIFRYDIETDITTNFHGIDMSAPYKVTYISAEYLGEYYMWVLDSEKVNFRETVYHAFKDNDDVRVKTYPTERKLHIFEFAGNESYMLQHFWYTLSVECDPDIMVGWNSIGFDFPYLYTRSHILPYYRSTEHKCTSFAEPQTVADLFPAIGKDLVCPQGDDKWTLPYITGIIVGDMQKLYEVQHQNKLESYALNFISDLELGLGKKAFPPAGASTDEWIEYNLWDTELLELLDNKVQITNFRFSLVKISKGPWADSENKLGLVSSLLYEKAKQDGVVLRTSKLAAIATEKHIKEFVGGFTQTNKGGLYEMLVDYDGKSMYPSLMMTFNIGPNTLRYTIPFKEALQIMTNDYDPNKVVRMYTAELYYRDGYELPYQDVTLRSVHEMIKKNNYIITPSGAIFCSMQEEKSIIYDLLYYLTTERDAVKKVMKEGGVLNMAKYNKQLALKTSANAFFGVFGFKPFFYYNKTLATAITTTGRMLIKCIMHAIENRYQKNGKTLLECAKTIDIFKTQDLFFKYTIYADTDGCVIQFGSMLENKGMTLEQKMEWVENELKDLNKYIVSVVDEIYTYFNKGEGARYMYFKEDWLANKGLFYPYKHKFYAIHLIREGGKDSNELLYRGIAIRKSTYPALTKQRLAELMEMVLDRKAMDFGKFFKRSAEIEQEFIDCCVNNDIRVGTPIRVSKNFEDFKVITQSADSMMLWNKLQGRDEFKILSRGYLFMIANIDFFKLNKFSPEEVKEIKKKFRMTSVCVPLDCEKIPDYITIDRKETMEKVWYTPYKNVFGPLLESSATTKKAVMDWL